FFFAREVPREEVYLTLSGSPIWSDSGNGVEGVLCTSVENTTEVVGARRFATLRKLGVDTALASASSRSVCELAAQGMEENPQDIPLAAIYLADVSPSRAVLAAHSGFGTGIPPFPDSIALTDSTASPWPFASVFRDQRMVDVPDLITAGGRLPG